VQCARLELNVRVCHSKEEGLAQREVSLYIHISPQCVMFSYVHTSTLVVELDSFNQPLECTIWSPHY